MQLLIWCVLMWAILRYLSKYMFVPDFIGGVTAQSSGKLKFNQICWWLFILCSARGYRWLTHETNCSNEQSFKHKVLERRTFDLICKYVHVKRRVVKLVQSYKLTLDILYQFCTQPMPRCQCLLKLINYNEIFSKN